MKILILSVCLLVLISACSQNITASKLQQDFNSHQYSRYVHANLHDEIPIEKTAVVVQKPQLDLRKRKPQATADLDAMIVNNGLFQPSSGRVSVKSLEKSASLNSVLNIALKRNLDIKSARQQAQASLAKYNQVEFLSDMLSQYSAFTDNIALTGSVKRNNSTAYPLPGLNAIKSSIIDESVKFSRLMLKQTTQDVITKIRIAYIELQAVRQQIHLLKQQTKIFKSLKEELQNNYATNTGELGLILQADIDIAESQNNLHDVRDKQDRLQASLNAILNLPPDAHFGGLDKLRKNHNTLNTDVIFQLAHKHRVEIALLHTELTKIQRIIKLSEKRLYPDLDAGFSRTKQGKFTTKAKIKTNNFFAKDDAYLSETRQKAKALTLKIAALKNTTTDLLQQNVSKYQSQQHTLKLYRDKIIPKAKASLDISKNAFEVGDSDNVKVIIAEIAILKYRLILLKALSDMQISQTKAMRLIGIYQG